MTCFGTDHHSRTQLALGPGKGNQEKHDEPIFYWEQGEESDGTAAWDTARNRFPSQRQSRESMPFGSATNNMSVFILSANISVLLLF